MRSSSSSRSFGNSMSALSISSISSTAWRALSERLPQPARDDVVADVVDLGVAELRVAQARDGVVLVQAVLRLGRRLDVPAVERLVERARDLLGQLGLAGAGLALDEQRPRQRDGRIDGHHQVLGRDVALRPFELAGHGGPRAGRRVRPCGILAQATSIFALRQGPGSGRTECLPARSAARRLPRSWRMRSTRSTHDYRS